MATRALVYETEFLDALVREFEMATKFNVAVALITNTGFPLLKKAMTSCLARRGRGELLVGIDLPSDPNALAALMKLQGKFPTQLSVKYFKSPDAGWFHPKFYVFKPRGKRRRALVGSSNLTAGGLRENYEASFWSDDPKAVTCLTEYFDELHSGRHAHLITGSWLAKYRRLWDERQRQQRDAERTRKKVRSIPHAPTAQRIPKQIRGKTFVFTGRIAGWERDRLLYPRVLKLGGFIGRRESALKNADCLVRANQLGHTKTTRKLEAARQFQVPIISEEEFLKML